eukprot:5611285-Alexandrium_andersonii.AAC.1
MPILVEASQPVQPAPPALDSGLADGPDAGGPVAGGPVPAQQAEPTPPPDESLLQDIPLGQPDAQSELAREVAEDGLVTPE